MDHIAHEIVFTGKKPSKAQVAAKVKKAANLGITLINVSWGENWFTLDKQGINGRWCGFGWLKDISADDMANELNRG